MTQPSHPHVHAEKDLLGKIILHYDQGMIEQAAAVIDVQDFELPHHQLIFQAMVNCSGEGIALESTNVFGELVKLPNGHEIGISYLSQMASECADGNSIAYLCEIIKERSNKNRITEFNLWLAAAREDFSLSARELASQAEARLLLVTEEMDEGHSDGVADLIRGSGRAAGRLREGRQVEQDLHTGFCDLDRLIGGFNNGTLIVLGARASVGKTSLMTDFAISAIRQGKRCMVYSIEMMFDEYVERMLCAHGRLPYHELRSIGYRSTDTMRRIDEAEAFIRTSGAVVHAVPGVKVDQIASVARLHQRQHGLDFLCVDYMQLIQAKDRRLPRQEQVAEMSRGFSALAKSLDIPVLVLCQLNRATMEERGALPKLHNLRESGAIEQDADMVLLLHRKGLHDRGQETSQEDRNEAQLLVAKNRSGPTGIVPLTFLAQSCSFADASRRESRPAAPQSAPNLADHFTDQDRGT